MSSFCKRLFLDPYLKQSSQQVPSSTFVDPGPISASTSPYSRASTSWPNTEPKLSYSKKLSAMFDKELKSIGIPKKRKICDIFAEISLASKTELTERLVRLLKGL